jgi:hypothetical protein
MNLLRRHIGRRVAGVGVGVALLMLGLEAPAFAAAPTIASFTPTSGPVNCVVVITGTAFTDSPAANTDINFVGTGGLPATDFAIISATEIWAVVPALTDGEEYTIEIVNNGAPSGVESTGTFLFTPGSGACAPTVTSLTPACGSASTTVVIGGTNLIDSDLDGGDVFFSPYGGTELATHTVPDVDGPTSLSVLVPATAADGPVKVVTDVGTGAFSDAAFQVPPPDCVTTAGHTRSITLKLKGKLTAKGKVSSTEATPFTDCVSGVPVKIQRKKSGSWKTVGKTTTSDTGAYSKKIKNKKGKYRAIAVKTTVPTDELCLKAKSPVRTH